MKKKTLWIWIISLVVVLTATVIVFAKYDDLAKQKAYNRQISEKVYDIKKPIVEDVKKEITISLPTGEKETLLYKETKIDDAGFKMHNYLSNDKIVTVSNSGKVLSFSVFGKKTVSEKEWKSEAELNQKAESLLKQYYLQDFTGYKISDTAYRDNNERYCVFFYKYYGKDGYISGESGGVEFLKDGSVVSYYLPDIDRYAKFDPESVANIGKKELSEYANKMVQEHYENGTIKSHEMKEARIINIEGKYFIEITVHTILNKPDHDVSNVMTFYYEI